MIGLKQDLPHSTPIFWWHNMLIINRLNIFVSKNKEFVQCLTQMLKPTIEKNNSKFWFVMFVNFHVACSFVLVGSHISISILFWNICCREIYYAFGVAWVCSHVVNTTTLNNWLKWLKGNGKVEMMVKFIYFVAHHQSMAH
jgi:hypothetical protein